jgi:DNA gyrase subunit A
VAEKGYGKKTSLEEYRAQSRGGSGLITYSVTDKTGDVVAARLEPIEKKEKPRDVLLATQMGKVIRIAEKQIPQLTRNTLGVRLIKLSKDDKVSSVAFLD